MGNNKIVIGLILVLILVGIILNKDVIFQEGNPVKMVIAIGKLHISDEKIVLISERPKKYIVRNKDGFQPFIEMMEDQGWEYSDQMGAGLIFEKKGIKHTATSRMYTRYYRVIKE